MQDRYTKEEYIDLVAQSPSNNFINSIYFFLAQGHAFNSTEVTNIQEHLTSEYPDISGLLYRIPLRMVPLFINHESEVIKAIALWRLRLRK